MQLLIHSQSKHMLCLITVLWMDIAVLTEREHYSYMAIKINKPVYLFQPEL